MSDTPTPTTESIPVISDVPLPPVDKPVKLEPKKKASGPVKCPCCQKDARSIGSDGFECIKCGSVFQDAVPPTLNGVTFDNLFSSATPGEQFVFPETELRCERSLAQLKEQGVTSVFSNGGIVAALVRAGFTVLTHTPNVVFSKPKTN